MALIKCPECGKEYSEKAATCPNCGAPNDLLNGSQQNLNDQLQTSDTTKKTNTGLNIAAFVVSLFSLIFAPLSIISIILIIIDAVKNKNKKRKKGLWIAALVISIIMIITLFVPKSGNNDAEQHTVVQENSNGDVSEGADPIETETNIPKEYIEVTADDLVDALNSNAMKAQNDYLDKYLQITGTLGTIDSSGKYISIDSEQFSLATIQCYMTSEAQKEVIMNMKKGDPITVKGYCKDMGEILGYQIDIEEITN